MFKRRGSAPPTALGNSAESSSKPVVSPASHIKARKMILVGQIGKCQEQLRALDDKEPVSSVRKQRKKLESQAEQLEKKLKKLDATIEKKDTDRPRRNTISLREAADLLAAKEAQVVDELRISRTMGTSSRAKAATLSNLEQFLPSRISVDSGTSRYAAALDTAAVDVSHSDTDESGAPSILDGAADKRPRAMYGMMSVKVYLNDLFPQPNHEWGWNRTAELYITINGHRWPPQGHVRLDKHEHYTGDRQALVYTALLHPKRVPMLKMQVRVNEEETLRDERLLHERLFMPLRPDVRRFFLGQTRTGGHVHPVGATLTVVIEPADLDADALRALRRAQNRQRVLQRNADLMTSVERNDWISYAHLCAPTATCQVEESAVPLSAELGAHLGLWSAHSVHAVRTFDTHVRLLNNDLVAIVTQICMYQYHLDADAYELVAHDDDDDAFSRSTSTGDAAAPIDHNIDVPVKKKGVFAKLKKRLSKSPRQSRRKTMLKETREQGGADMEALAAEPEPDEANTVTAADTLRQSSSSARSSLRTSTSARDSGTERSASARSSLRESKSARASPAVTDTPDTDTDGAEQTAGGAGEAKSPLATSTATGDSAEAGAAASAVLRKKEAVLPPSHYFYVSSTLIEADHIERDECFRALLLCAETLVWHRESVSDVWLLHHGHRHMLSSFDAIHLGGAPMTRDDTPQLDTVYEYAAHSTPWTDSDEVFDTDIEVVLGDEERVRDDTTSDDDGLLLDGDVDDLRPWL